MQSPLLGASGTLLEPSVLAQALSGEAPLIDVTVDGRPGRMIGLVTTGPDRYVVAVGLFTDKIDATLGRLRTL